MNREHKRACKIPKDILKAVTASREVYEEKCSNTKSDQNKMLDGSLPLIQTWIHRAI